MIYFFRLVNFVQIFFNYILSLLFRKVIVAPMPFAISIEPTNICNLYCPECPTGNKSLTRKKGQMNLLLFENLIQSIYKKTFYLNLYFQGEPLLHPQIKNMIAIARSYKMYVVLSTNGQLLDKKTANNIVNSSLSKIIISFDGISQASYEKYRKGGDLEKVKQGIKYLIESKNILKKKKPTIEIQVLVNRYNEKELAEITKWLKSFGKLKIIKKSMQIYNDFSYLPENKKYKRYTFTEKGWKLNKRINNKCFRIWSQCVITYDGFVVPCCFDKNADNIVGNINILPFKQIWKGDSFNSFRKKVLNKRKNIIICNNCTE